MVVKVTRNKLHSGTTSLLGPVSCLLLLQMGMTSTTNMPKILKQKGNVPELDN